MIIIAISSKKSDRRTDYGLLSCSTGIVRCSSEHCIMVFSVPGMYVCWHTTIMFKKNLNASKPSEHSPSEGKNCQNI